MNFTAARRARTRIANLVRGLIRGLVRGLVSGALFALAAGGAPALAGGAQPLDPQPAAGDLEAGLAVRYYFEFFRHIDELSAYMAAHEGVAGEPLPALDYYVGEEPVLTSGVVDGVGAEIVGLIRLDAPGAYSFILNSNDGVRLEIGGAQVLDDPEVHADRYSDIARLTVEQPGWYAIHLLYFERKVTATLELYWKRPGEEAGRMKLVPAALFAHLK